MITLPIGQSSEAGLESGTHNGIRRWPVAAPWKGGSVWQVVGIHRFLYLFVPLAELLGTVVI